MSKVRLELGHKDTPHEEHKQVFNSFYSDEMVKCHTYLIPYTCSLFIKLQFHFQLFSTAMEDKKDSPPLAVASGTKLSHNILLNNKHYGNK